METNYIAHHGIKGQKWGVRRFQNPDGTLTKTGKKRYERMVSDSKQYGKTAANLERQTRSLNIKTDKLKPGEKILVSKDVKNAYSLGVSELNRMQNLLSKKYDDVFFDIKKMDDGHDYVVSYLTDRNMGTLEYFTLIE